MSNPYTPEFYKSYVGGSLQSARRIVPLVLDLIPARSVVDVGCGVATYLSVFRDHGVSDFIGTDGDYVPRDQLLIDRARFRPADLARGFDLRRRFDLAISLEVAEHLPRDAGPAFIRGLTAHADVILFSAAIPHQGGADHINEQFASYWASGFAQLGYAVFDPFRPKLWADHSVEVWYRQNLLLFANDAGRAKHPKIAALKPAPLETLDIIHPEMFMRTAKRLGDMRSFLKSSKVVEVKTGPNGDIDLNRLE